MCSCPRPLCSSTNKGRSDSRVLNGDHDRSDLRLHGLTLSSRRRVRSASATQKRTTGIDPPFLHIRRSGPGKIGEGRRTGSYAQMAVAEAAIPGLSPAPPLFGSQEASNRLWHCAFNRLTGVNEQLVGGREHLYFGHQFATKAARPLPDCAVQRTSTPSPPARKPCAAASSSTAHSTQPSPRTRSVVLDGCPSPSW